MRRYASSRSRRFAEPGTGSRLYWIRIQSGSGYSGSFFLWQIGKKFNDCLLCHRKTTNNELDEKPLATYYPPNIKFICFFSFWGQVWPSLDPPLKLKLDQKRYLKLVELTLGLFPYWGKKSGSLILRLNSRIQYISSIGSSHDLTSVLDPDWIRILSGQWSTSRRVKMAHKNKQKFSCFECWMFSFKDWRLLLYLGRLLWRLRE